MPHIAYLTNASPRSGVGLRAATLQEMHTVNPAFNVDEYALDGAAGTVTCNGSIVLRRSPWPGVLGVKTIGWLRLGRSLRRHLLQAQPPDLWHATNQTLSFMLPPNQPTLVTVHDIIELTHPQSRGASAAAWYLYRGILHATHIIAVSHYTAKALQTNFNLPVDRITVIPNGVGPEFHPLVDSPGDPVRQALRKKLGLSSDQPVLLYVGSEHPRKNIHTVIDIVARLQQQFPNVTLLKVGLPGFESARINLNAYIHTKGVRDRVHFLNEVSDTRLNELYNLADVLVFPSYAEGFGMPPLQAMAAGLPVVCSNATSLPEIVGDAALMADPDDSDALTQHTAQLLKDPSLRSKMRTQGFTRSARFSWAAAARLEAEVYDKLLST